MEQEINELTLQFVIGLMVFYGLYLIITGVLIVRKNKKILNLVHYIKILFMFLLGYRARAKQYKRLQINSVDWHTRGPLTIIIGISVVLSFSFIWFAFK